MENKNDKAVEEKVFLKSLDALENLAKGMVGEEPEAIDPDLETPDEDLNKSVEEDDGVTGFEADEDLNKSVADEDEDEDEDLNKSVDEEDEDEDEDEDVEKSFADSAAEGSENIEKAIEVSDFLADLVDQVGFAIDDMRKSISDRMDEMEKSMANVTAFNVDLAKSLKNSFTEMDTGIEYLRKSVDVMGTAPAHARKSITTLNKSFAGADPDGEAGKTPTGKADVLKALELGLEKSLTGINPMDIVQYETTGTLGKDAAAAIGMEPIEG